MQMMIDLVNQLQDFCTEGTDLRQFETIVRKIDARGKFLLSALNFAPDDVPHVALFAKQEDERLKDIQEAETVAKDAPEAAIPYVISAYCRSIRDTVKRDLLAFATDFSAETTLRFTISFSSFAISFSSFHRETEKKQIQNRLQDMRDEGYIIEGANRKEYVLTDCDANRQLLRNYCLKTFGSEPWSISTHKNIIQDMAMVIGYDKYIPTLKSPELTQAPLSLLTADDAVRLSKAISDIKFALATYSAMTETGNGNIVLSCLHGHIYEIESITGVHGEIWAERENEVADTRRKNQQIRATEEEIQRASIAVLAPQLRELIENAQENMEALAHKMGLYLDKFSLREYGQIDLSLMSSCMVYKEPEIELDGQRLENGGEFYVYNTPKNLRKILSTIESVAPSATLESYEVKPYQHFEYIKRINLRTSDSLDMLRILQVKNAIK